MGLSGVEYSFTGGSRGWKGDVPVVRFSSDKLETRGWRPRFSSADALTDSIDSNIEESAAEASVQSLTSHPKHASS